MTENTNKIKASTDTTPPIKPFTILSEKASKIFIWVGIAVIVISLFLFLWHGNINPSADIKPDFIAQLGDFVGGVAGSIWALAGIILFYVTLQEQKKEFSKTQAIFKIQNKTQELAQFETSFYNLMELFQSIVSQIEIDYEEKIILSETVYDNPRSFVPNIVHPEVSQIIQKSHKGKECFISIYKQINLEKINEASLNTKKEDIRIYEQIFSEYEGYLEPYFSLLNEILIKIENVPKDIDKNYYARIVGAYLTTTEKELIKIYMLTYLVSPTLKSHYDKIITN